ncbi:IS21 family transposase [Oligella ureolytica]
MLDKHRSAAKAGISERSARRIEHNQLQPKSSQPRHWRTRDDPLQAVWDSIVLPWIREDNEITPVGIFDYLCEHHQDIFRPSARRTLERRIANWRSVHGSPKDVIFLQTHGYGELGIADFTYINLGVRIADDPLKHLLFHYRLPASGWAYAQVVYGGESFTALSDGLQNAFQASNGVPLDVRTDSLR